MTYHQQFNPGDRVVVVVLAPTKPEPEPTHKHPEGLYRGHGTYIVVRHEEVPETYSFLYVQNALDGLRDPVNRGMTQLSELGYTLVTEFSA